MGKLNLFISAVVWQPGDNEVVERPVAERRVCVIRGVSWSRLCRALLEHCECTLGVLGVTHIYVYLYLYVYKGRNKKKRSIVCDVLCCRKTDSSSTICTKCLPWTLWRPRTHCRVERTKSTSQRRSARCSTPSLTTR